MQQVLPQSQQQEQPFLAEWLQAHPNTRAALSALGTLLGFFLNGHFIVFVGRWVVLTSGRIAETAMLFATLFVTANYVAHDFVTGLLGQVTVTTLSSLSLIAFSLLPEVILFSAIITSYQHWHAVYRNRRDAAAWTWAILNTIPTAAFFAMTIYTISTFVGSAGHIGQATGMALVLRCLAGWFFALVGLIHAGVGGKRNVTIVQQPKPQPNETATLVEQLREEMQAGQEAMQQQVQQVTQAFAALPAPTPTIDVDALAAQITETVTRTLTEQVPVVTPGGDCPAGGNIQAEPEIEARDMQQAPRTRRLPSAKAKKARAKRGKPGRRVPAGDIRERIRAISEAEPELSPQMIGTRVGVTRQTVHNHLKELRSVSTGEQQSAEQNSFCELSTKNNGRKTNI